jgi:hypothetical protein
MCARLPLVGHDGPLLKLMSRRFFLHNRIRKLFAGMRGGFINGGINVQ